MGVKSQDNKQSWNDSFAAFMADDLTGKIKHTPSFKKQNEAVKNEVKEAKAAKADKKGKKHDKGEDKKEVLEEIKEEGKEEKPEEVKDEIDV